MIQPLWKMVWKFLKKLGAKPVYDPAVPLLAIYSEESKIEKDTCTPMFIAALFTIARTWKQPRRPSTDKWIKKQWYIYIIEYHTALKRNASESVLMRWMNLEPIIQSEVSQKEKNKLSYMGFPGGSTGKESARNAGDLGLIPGLGRSPGEGTGYPLQYSGLENTMDT